jgi:hypothetical protein
MLGRCFATDADGSLRFGGSWQFLMLFLESRQSFEHCLRHGGTSRRRARLKPHMHDERLLHCHQFVRVLSVHAQEHVHPLFVDIEDLAIDKEFIAKLAFSIEAGSRLECVDRAVGFLAILGVKAEELVESIGCPAERDVIGEVSHMPVVVDPLGGNFEVEYLGQLAHTVELYAGRRAKNQWDVTAGRPD